MPVRSVRLGPYGVAMEPVTLSAPGLTLSVPTLDDVPAITRACQDPETAAWTTVPDPYEPAHAAGFVQEMVARGWASGFGLTWAVRPEGDAELGGMIGLDGVRDGHAEIGYWTAPWGRGRGLTTRAVLAVLDHAFDELGLVRVTWHAFAGNWPSRRIAWRAGFRFEGLVRLGGVQRDTRRDDWGAGLLAADPRGRPAEPWPDEAPSDLRPQPELSPPVPVHAVERERMGA